MIFPDKLTQKFAQVFDAASRVVSHVKATSKSPHQVDVGDFIVITQDSGDKTGEVVGIRRTVSGTRGYPSISLRTKSGVENVRISKNSFIHIIKKAKMEELRKHDSYERDLHSIEDKGVPETQKDEHHKFPPTTREDKKVDSEKSSEFPTSKKLSLQKRKAYQFAASDLVYSSSGVPSQIIEILPGDETQAAMAVLRSTTGNGTFVDFLVDLRPIKSSSKKLLLRKNLLSLRDTSGVTRDDVAKKRYGKSYASLTELEKLDVNDSVLGLSN